MSEKKPLCLYSGQVKELQSGDTVAGASSGASASSDINHIINGNFDIWQRGTVQTANGYGSDDRWGNLNYGTTKNHSRIGCTDTERAFFNASFFSRTDVNSIAGSINYCTKGQKIEDVTKLAGKTVTLSFWAKSDAPKNMAVEFRQNFGTGGTPSAQTEMIGVQKIALTDQWQKFELTVEIPSIAGKTLGTDGSATTYTWLIFWFDAGSAFDTKTAGLGQQSGIFDIAQVQLEEGSSATAFKHRHMAEEMALCQRYYETTDGTIGGFWSGSPTSGNTYFAHHLFRVAKRVTPSVVLTNVSALRFLTTVGTVSSLSKYSFLESRSASATSTSGYFASAFTADAEL